MRKAKFFGAISLLLLSISILGAGIFAATTTSNESMTVGGIINIPITSVDVSVKGWIGDITEDNINSPNYESSEQNTTWQLGAGDLTLEAGGKNEVAGSDFIKLTLRVTNLGDSALDVYFTKNSETSPRTSDVFNNSEDESQVIVSVELTQGEVNAGADNYVDVTITFRLVDLPDLKQEFGFNYTLNVVGSN